MADDRVGGISVWLLGDLDLPMRGRTYREPPGAHVLFVRGTEVDLALEHMERRTDCLGVAIIGAPDPPDLTALAGRRLLVVDGDRSRMWELAEVGLQAGARAEWIHAARPSPESLSAWALPVAGLILGTGTAEGSAHLLADLGGEMRIDLIVAALREGGCTDAAVVHHDPDLLATVSRDVSVKASPPNLRSAVAIGLGSLPPEVAGALLVPDTRSALGAKDVALLLREWRDEEAPTAVSLAERDADRLPPVIVDRCLWPRLSEISPVADQRGLLEALGVGLRRVPQAPVPEPEDHEIIRLPRRPAPDL